MCAGTRKRIDLRVAADSTLRAKLDSQTNGAIKEWGVTRNWLSSPSPVRFDGPHTLQHLAQTRREEERMKLIAVAILAIIFIGALIIKSQDE